MPAQGAQGRLSFRALEDREHGCGPASRNPVSLRSSGSGRGAGWCQFLMASPELPNAQHREQSQGTAVTVSADRRQLDPTAFHPDNGDPSGVGVQDGLRAERHNLDSCGSCRSERGRWSRVGEIVSATFGLGFNRPGPSCGGVLRAGCGARIPAGAHRPATWRKRRKGVGLRRTQSSDWWTRRRCWSR